MISRRGPSATSPLPLARPGEFHEPGVLHFSENIIHIFLSLSLYIYICIYIYIYIHIHIHICMCMSIYIYIYTYTCICLRGSLEEHCGDLRRPPIFQVERRKQIITAETGGDDEPAQRLRGNASRSRLRRNSAARPGQHGAVLDAVLLPRGVDERHVALREHLQIVVHPQPAPVRVLHRVLVVAGPRPDAVEVRGHGVRRVAQHHLYNNNNNNNNNNTNDDNNNNTTNNNNNNNIH